jgi:hypothetical protein
MENSRYINIYLVDNRSDSEKRKAAFTQALPSQLFQQVTKKDDAHVICGHSSDVQGYNEGKTKYAEVNSPKLTIVYSGGGTPTISDADLNSEKVLRIEKSISESDSLSPDDWNKIHSLINIEQNIFLESILILGKGEFLSALSILCQGYLLNALSHTDLDEQTIDSSIKDAVGLMKWEDPNLTYCYIFDAKWWTDCFDLKQLQTLKMINSPKITRLLEKVATEKKSPDLKIVAEAYLAICTILPTI